MEDYLEAMVDDMVGAMDHLKRALAGVRTGRATPKLVENVQILVASYGATMPLNQLATIQAPDARLLTVTPWDKTTISDIERGLLQAGLGLNPSSDGQMVRLPVPPLTQSRRQDLVKQVRRSGEDAKVALRHIRREYNETFKAAENDGEVSEDDCRRLLANVQESTNNYVKEVEAVVQAKEAEVIEL
jgi:ribosome recycling factor